MGHMTSNNETVYRQIPSAGNIAKAMTSNGKHLTVYREMLTAVAHDHGKKRQLYNKSLNDRSIGE